MINKILLKLREEMGISQEIAAKALNVSRSALGYYERGERQPDASFIIKAADFFGVTADYLLGRSDYRSVENQAIANKFELPLSDKAISFLKSVPPELQPTLDLLVADQNFEDFLLELVKNSTRQKALQLVNQERNRQDEKWGEQNHPPQYWTGILGEEFGEYCQAVNETVFDNGAEARKKGGYDNMMKELTQVAAVAVGAMEALMRQRIREQISERKKIKEIENYLATTGRKDEIK